MNNSLFEIGQKVVCVDSKPKGKFIPPPLVEGKQYKILGMTSCGCGALYLDVGLRSAVFSGNRCNKCLAQYDSSYVHYVCQFRFVPLDFDRQADEAIHQALKEDLKIKNFQDN